MKRLPLPASVFLGIILFTALSWLVLPRLQNRATTLDAQVSEQVERARRLLHQYHAGLDYKALLLGHLEQQKVDTDIQDPAALMDSVAEAYQERVEQAWSLYHPTDWKAEPQPAKLKTGSDEKQIRDGVSQRGKIIKANGELLEQALRHVDEALALGGSETASHQAGLSLKGVILHHMGLRARVRANLKREEADPYLRQLMDLRSVADSATPLRELESISGVAAQMKQLQSAITQVESELSADREKLAAGERSTGELGSRLNIARARAEQARKALEDLRQNPPLASSTGVDSFATQVLAQDQAYRDSLREARALENGNFRGAAIDASGDFLHGKYVADGRADGLTINHGVDHHRDERVLLVAAIAIRENAINVLRADLARLEQMRNAHEARQLLAAKKLEEAQKLAAAAFRDWETIQEEVAGLDDKARSFLNKATQASKQATTAAELWVRDGRQEAQNLAQSARERSPSTRVGNSDWLVGFTLAQTADSNLAGACLEADRYRSFARAHEVFEAVIPALGMTDIKTEDWKKDAEDARSAGVALVEQAVTTLEKVHRSVGNHWTVTAQAAGAMYVMVLLGHPAYAQESITAYRSALKGREDRSFAEPIAARLKQLEARKQ
ncbi:MAG: hypothetical protein AABZ47_00855 [Planctomycetota bacterium]